MHIPDGILNPPVWGSLDLLAAPAIWWVARRASSRSGIDSESPDAPLMGAPLMGMLGAFVFAAQMINFPLAAGTSGHLIGGTLLALTLGPASATVVLTAVLALQALIFQDGGVLAFGANAINMAFAGVAAGYLPSIVFGRRPAAYFMGGVLSVSVSATLALSEVVLSGVRIPAAMLWTALAVFLVNGLVEGAITLVVLRAIERLRPSLLPSLPSMSRAVPVRAWHVRPVVVLAVSAVVVGAVFLASTAPDQLQRLVEELHLPSAPAVSETTFWALRAAAAAGCVVAALWALKARRAAARASAKSGSD